MAQFFTMIIYQPIFNAFVGLYDLVGDVGIVILLLTIIIQLILYPLNSKSIQAQKGLADMQPKLDKLKQELKGDQQKLAAETMKLYKEHKINPFGSCLPVLIQIPVFLGLFYVLKSAFAPSSFELLYSFIPNPGSINPVSLHLFDLAKPSIVLAVLAGLAQFVQTKMLSTKRPPKVAGEGAKDEGMASMMNKQMLYMMPILTVIIGIKFPAGVTLYWFVRTLLAAGQQWILFKKNKSSQGGGTASGTGGDIIEGKIVS